MTIIASTTFSVANQASLSVNATAIVLAAAGDVLADRGRLVHPTLGTYDYINTPNETLNIDGDITAPPIWTHEMTLGGDVDTNWSAFINDAKVIERWTMGDTGSTIEHLRALWLFFSNPPEDPIATPVLWYPNYANLNVYNVVLTAVRAGREGYTLDRRLLSYGYAPSPVELELRVLGYTI